MQYRTWLKKYKPLLDSEGSPKLYETYGEDLSMVTSQPRSHIWTIVEGDNGKLYLTNGYHRVNRLNYIITQEPVADEAFIEFKW